MQSLNHLHSWEVNFVYAVTTFVSFDNIRPKYIKPKWIKKPRGFSYSNYRYFWNIFSYVLLTNRQWIFPLLAALISVTTHYSQDRNWKNCLDFEAVQHLHSQDRKQDYPSRMMLFCICPWRMREQMWLETHWLKLSVWQLCLFQEKRAL